MKYQYIFILVFTLYSARIVGQDGILFKMNYLPEKNYRQTTTMINKSITNYTGSDLFMDKLKEKGMENPSKTNNQLNTEITIHTGKQTQDGNIPIVMEYIRVDNENGPKPIPEGTKFFGSASSSRMLVLDSISSSELSEATKASLLKSVKSTHSQLLIPDLKFKIGDTFTQEMPLSIPIADMTIEMRIKTTYKLISITNDIALFDIPQVYNMTSTISKIPISAVGIGNGKIRFDLKNKYFLSYETQSELKMNMDFGKFRLDMNQETNYVQQTTMVE